MKIFVIVLIFQSVNLNDFSIRNAPEFFFYIENSKEKIISNENTFSCIRMIHFSSVIFQSVNSNDFSVEQIFREANVSLNGHVKYEDFVKIACAPVPDYYWSILYFINLLDKIVQWVILILIKAQFFYRLFPWNYLNVRKQKIVKFPKF